MASATADCWLHFCPKNAGTAFWLVFVSHSVKYRVVQLAYGCLQMLYLQMIQMGLTLSVFVDALMWQHLRSSYAHSPNLKLPSVQHLCILIGLYIENTMLLLLLAAALYNYSTGFSAAWGPWSVDLDGLGCCCITSVNRIQSCDSLLLPLG